MLLAWSFGIALSFVLCMFDILPLSASWQSLAIGFRADTPVGYWLIGFSQRSHLVAWVVGNLVAESQVAVAPVWTV